MTQVGGRGAAIAPTDRFAADDAAHLLWTTVEDEVEVGRGLALTRAQRHVGCLDEHTKRCAVGGDEIHTPYELDNLAHHDLQPEPSRGNQSQHEVIRAIRALQGAISTGFESNQTQSDAIRAISTGFEKTTSSSPPNLAARPQCLWAESHAISRARRMRNPPKMYPFMLRLAGCMMSSVRISLAPIGTRAGAVMGTRGAVMGISLAPIGTRAGT